jgi:hypothetical protein
MAKTAHGDDGTPHEVRAKSTMRPERRVVDEAVIAGWDRERMLPRLIPVGPEELADRTPEGRLAILRRLAQALRGERRRGRAGHWSYDLDRHIGLVQALAAERRFGGRAAARTSSSS